MNRLLANTVSLLILLIAFTAGVVAQSTIDTAQLQQELEVLKTSSSPEDLRDQFYTYLPAFQDSGEDELLSDWYITFIDLHLQWLELDSCDYYTQLFIADAKGRGPYMQMYAHAFRAEYLWMTGQVDAARESYETAYARAEASGDIKLLYRANANLGRIYSYAYRDKETSNKYYRKSLVYAKQLDGLSVASTLYNMKSNVEEYREQIKLLQEARDSLGEVKSTLQPLILTDLAVAYFNLEDYQLGIEYQIAALRASREYGMRDMEIGGFQLLAGVYRDLGELELARSYIDSAFQVENVEKSSNLSNLYYSSAAICRLEPACDSSAQILRRGLTMTINRVGEEYILYGGLADYFGEVNELDSAYHYSQLILNAKNVRKDVRAQAMGVMSNIYFHRGDYQAALQFAQQSNELNKERSSLNAEFESTELLVKVQRKLGNYQAASDLQERLILLKDSLGNKQSVQAMFKTKYQSEFEFEKEKLELQQAQERALLEARQSRTRLVGWFVAIVAMLLGFLLWRTYRSNKVIQEYSTQLEGEKENLARLNGVKDQLFSVLAHDLRKPALAFRGISKKVKYLIQKQEYERLQRIGDSIDKDATTLSTIIDNLLSWAASQKDALPYRPERLNSRQVVSEIIDSYQDFIDEKAIQVQVALEDEGQLYADGRAFYSIVKNLLDNAIKFTPKGGQISITGQRQKREYQIRIADSGVGIPEDKIAHIFELSNQKSTPGTEGEKGTGLGLHLVKELVELNKGYIRLDPETLRGTAFELGFPALA